jgi:hypothetical protein
LGINDYICNVYIIIIYHAKQTDLKNSKKL